MICRIANLWVFACCCHHGLTLQVAETLPSATVLRQGTTSKPALSVAEERRKHVAKYVRAVAPRGNFSVALLMPEIRLARRVRTRATTRAEVPCVASKSPSTKLDGFIDFCRTMFYPPTVVSHASVTCVPSLLQRRGLNEVSLRRRSCVVAHEPSCAQNDQVL